MTIPITFQKTVRFRRPPGTSDHLTATKFRNLIAICRAQPIAGSKKDEHLPPFWALSRFRQMLSTGVAIRQQLWLLSRAVKRHFSCEAGSRPTKASQVGRAGAPSNQFSAAEADSQPGGEHEKGRSDGRCGLKHGNWDASGYLYLSSPSLDGECPHGGAGLDSAGAAAAGVGAAQLGAGAGATGAGAGLGAGFGLGAGAGFGAATGFGASGAATAAGAACFFAALFFAGLFFAGVLALAFLADFLGAAALDFLADFLADFFADFLTDFLADFFEVFFEAFFEVFLAVFFFAVTTFLFFLAFLSFLFFFPLAIVILLLPPINIYRSNVHRAS
jgi:hypothetical protein